jgi:hypothetical protein
MMGCRTEHSRSPGALSGPGTVIFADASNPKTTATFSIAGDYVLRLTASDAQLTSRADIQIVAAQLNGPSNLTSPLGAWGTCSSSTSTRSNGDLISSSASPRRHRRRTSFSFSDTLSAAKLLTIRSTTSPGLSPKRASSAGVCANAIILAEQQNATNHSPPVSSFMNRLQVPN